MACLLKPPQGQKKGCVSFTTPEHDMVIRKDAAALAAIESIKDRYFVGLHHNWHDFDFIYDPLFDFSMAGAEDLIERNGQSFPLLDIECANFVPPQFFLPRHRPFWDVINVTRQEGFKNQSEFLHAIRAIYDRGHKVRVLHLCPVPRARPGEDPVPAIRREQEALFSMEERRLFTLMTMDWDHPRPLDMDTVAFFYRSARVFVHTAHDERRSRITAYSFANGMPVVGRDNIGSLLPKELRTEPFFFAYRTPDELPDRILDALGHQVPNADWSQVTALFRPENSVVKLSSFLEKLAAARGEDLSPAPINTHHLDYRMARHHIPAFGVTSNTLMRSIPEFCAAVRDKSDEELAVIAAQPYPEEALFGMATSAPAPAGSSARPVAAPVRPRASAGPRLHQKLRTLLRKGFRIPLTRRRLMIDIMPDPH
jgi:hypothetical protein